MLKVDLALTSVATSRENVLALHESINMPLVSIPNVGTAPTQAFVLGLRNEAGSYAVMVVLRQNDNDANLVYVSDPRALTAEQYRFEEAEGLRFVESMGFLMNDHGFRGLAAERQREVMERTPIFAGARVERTVDLVDVEDEGPAPQTFEPDAIFGGLENVPMLKGQPESPPSGLRATGATQRPTVPAPQGAVAMGRPIVGGAPSARPAGPAPAAALGGAGTPPFPGGAAGGAFAGPAAAGGVLAPAPASGAPRPAGPGSPFASSGPPAPFGGAGAAFGSAGPFGGAPPPSAAPAPPGPGNAAALPGGPVAFGAGAHSPPFAGVPTQPPPGAGTGPMPTFGAGASSPPFGAHYPSGTPSAAPFGAPAAAPSMPALSPAALGRLGRFLSTFCLIAAVGLGTARCAHQPSPDDPLDAAAQNKLDIADHYAAEGQWKEAIGAYEAAIEAAPAGPFGHHGLGLAYLYLDRPEQAEAALSKAIALNPSFSMAKNSLASLYLQQSRCAEAEALLKDVTADIMYPTPEFAQDNLARAEHCLGKSKDALARLTRVVTSKPQFCRAYLTMADIATESRAPEAAIQACEDFTNRCELHEQIGKLVSPENRALCYYRKGMAQAALGDVDAARESLSKCDSPGTYGQQCRASLQLLEHSAWEEDGHE